MNRKEEQANNLDLAIQEARRFIERALFYQVNGGKYHSCKHRAATKRASMDLTRALADYRSS